MAGLLVFPSSADIVAVYDQNFNQQFPNARPLIAEVREPSRKMQHPIESGQILTDYQIFLPICIEIPTMVAPEFVRDTYQQIANLYRSSQLLFVQTLTALYANMIISELPHNENPLFFNSIRVPLRFEQVQVVQAQTSYAAVAPSDQNTQNLGTQNPGEIAGVQTSTGLQTIALDNTGNPLAANNSGSISGVATTSGIQSIPLQPPGNYDISGVATVGGTQTIMSSFQ